MKSVSLLAVEALTSVLEEENRSLAALDFTAAARCLARKQAALAAVGAAGPEHGMQGAAGALQAAAAANRVLLERAIAVQGRVLGILAQAARASVPSRYSARGGVAACRSPVAFAINARA